MNENKTKLQKLYEAKQKLSKELEEINNQIELGNYGLSPNWPSPIHKWRVTTEGDVEGRSIKFIGEYSGHIADITKMLVESGVSPCYSFRFTPVKKLEQMENPKKIFKGCDISLDIDSGTWSMDGEQRKRAISKWMQKNDFEVQDGTGYACVKLIPKNS